MIPALKDGVFWEEAITSSKFGFKLPGPKGPGFGG